MALSLVLIKPQFEERYKNLACQLTDNKPQQSSGKP